MKRFRQSLRMVLHEPTLFHGYRWLAWGLAILLLLFSQASSKELAFHIWLWVLVAVFNLLATALAHSYVRIARLRPVVLGLDIVASVVLIWVSGGTVLPFLPYALGALVLPTLLFGWRGGLFASAVFVLLDQVALWSTGWQRGVSSITSFPDLLVRVLLPFAFVFGFSGLVSLVRQATAQTQSPILNRAGRSSLSGNERPGGLAPQRRTSRFTPPLSPFATPFEPAVADTSVAAPLAALRASDPTIEELRRTLIALTPGTALELPAALELLAAGFQKRSGVEVRTDVVGRVRVLTRAQYATLLRLAQESLLNVQQHAHASHAVVTLRFDLVGLTLSVEDDGVGLLDGTYERPGVHSLRVLAYRLAEIDGLLDVSEGHLGGVAVRGIIPL